jgi:LmbE family N-acetylglucosaminyl deacetylase
VQACQRLGVGYHHFLIPDCIYRRRPQDGKALIQRAEDLFDPQVEPEEALIAQLTAELAARLPSGATLVSPLALGNHVDHRLTRQAAQRLRPPDQGLLFYADFPYALQHPPTEKGLVLRAAEISPAGLEAWQDAVAAYASQLSSFWDSPAAMRAQLAQYCAHGGGRLWAFSP